jgi:hypothetical protein
VGLTGGAASGGAVLMAILALLWGGVRGSEAGKGKSAKCAKWETPRLAFFIIRTMTHDRDTESLRRKHGAVLLRAARKQGARDKYAPETDGGRRESGPLAGIVGDCCGVADSVRFRTRGCNRGGADGAEDAAGWQVANRVGEGPMAPVAAAAEAPS